jgi:hypothetical protein
MATKKNTTGYQNFCRKDKDGNTIMDLTFGRSFIDYYLRKKDIEVKIIKDLIFIGVVSYFVNAIWGGKTTAIVDAVIVSLFALDSIFTWIRLKNKKI